MNRRSFINALLAVPLAAVMPKPKFAWDKTRVDFFASNWKPHPKQLEFLAKAEDLYFAGIPYHQYNASTGEWLGIKRSQEVINELANLVNHLENNRPHA
jgi:hypothetical protein